MGPVWSAAQPPRIAAPDQHSLLVLDERHRVVLLRDLHVDPAQHLLRLDVDDGELLLAGDVHPRAFSVGGELERLGMREERDLAFDAPIRAAEQDQRSRIRSSFA